MELFVELTFELKNERLNPRFAESDSESDPRAYCGRGIDKRVQSSVSGLILLITKDAVWTIEGKSFCNVSDRIE